MARSRTPLDPQSALASPFYAFGALLVALPLADLVQSVGSPQPGNVQWRFAAIGLLSSVLLTPMLGVVVAIAVAAVRGDVRVQRALSVLCLLAAAMLLILLAAFALDVLQLQSTIPDAGRASFRAAWMRAVLKLGSATVVLLFLGYRGVRSSSWRPVRSDEPVRVVVSS